MRPIGFHTHDHERCVDAAKKAAGALAEARGLKLTPIRRRVLEILLETHRALGAYDILERLRAEGRPAQPPTAYRALDFLVGNGLAHRVEKLNAFVACNHPDAEHAPSFLICRGCETVAEARIAVDGGDLAGVAGEAGFRIEKMAMEAVGLCPNCRGAE